MKRTVDASAHIDNTPEAVIAHVADVRNRAKYFPALMAVANVQGEPTLGQQPWDYTFTALGLELKGSARCTEYEAGKRYSFQTEGDARSTWNYRAERDGQGTRLSLHLEYTVPDGALGRLPAGADPAALEQQEAARMFENL